MQAGTSDLLHSDNASVDRAGASNFPIRKRLIPSDIACNMDPNFFSRDSGFQFPPDSPLRFMHLLAARVHAFFDARVGVVHYGLG